MTCRELTEFLDRYLAGEVSTSERREFDHHLSICSACVNYLESYKTTVQLAAESLRDKPEAGVPEAVPEDLVKAILASRNR